MGMFMLVDVLYICRLTYIISLSINPTKYTLSTIKNGQSRDTGNIRQTVQNKDKQIKNKCIDQTNHPSGKNNLVTILYISMVFDYISHFYWSFLKYNT